MLYARAIEQREFHVYRIVHEFRERGALKFGSRKLFYLGLRVSRAIQ